MPLTLARFVLKLSPSRYREIALESITQRQIAVKTIATEAFRLGQESTDSYRAGRQVGYQEGYDDAQLAAGLVPAPRQGAPV